MDNHDINEIVNLTATTLQALVRERIGNKLNIETPASKIGREDALNVLTPNIESLISGDNDTMAKFKMMCDMRQQERDKNTATIRIGRGFEYEAVTREHFGQYEAWLQTLDEIHQTANSINREMVKVRDVLFNNFSNIYVNNLLYQFI